jgi:DNA polymerase III sliding clamp (beta) subunit (PCNA family)
MRITRENFLGQLESVQPGLSAREIIEQSSCFIFQEGEVVTYNDEIACRQECSLSDVAGAVPAEPLLAILRKLNEEEIEVSSNEGELLIKGKKRQAGIKMEMNILLPIDTVDRPKKWKSLPKNFTEAVTIIGQCASKDESQFVITCVHLHPKWIEACDNYQIARYPMETGLEESTLIRREALKHITTLDMNSFSETKSWMHFKNENGLVLSCRRYVEDYPDLQPYLSVKKGEKTEFPKGLKEATEKAEIFSQGNIESNQVEVSLCAGRLKLKGRGVTGWYSEVKKVSYSGGGISFLITPQLLRELVTNYNECEITPGTLKVDSGSFIYVTCLGKPKE